LLLLLLLQCCCLARSLLLSLLLQKHLLLYIERVHHRRIHHLGGLLHSFAHHILLMRIGASGYDVGELLLLRLRIHGVNWRGTGLVGGLNFILSLHLRRIGIHLSGRFCLLRGARLGGILGWFPGYSSICLVCLIRILLICPKLQLSLLLLLLLLLDQKRLLLRVGDKLLILLHYARLGCNHTLLLLKKGEGGDCLLKEVIGNHDNLLRWRTWN